MKEIALILMMFSVIIGACSSASENRNPEKSDKDQTDRNVQLELATFAGGCFWCMEHPFEELDGVVEVISGYTGGDKENPTYKEVCMGGTGHLEVVQIKFDPAKITYSELHLTAIFYHDEKQKERAEKSKEELDKSGRYDKPIVTEIREATKFYKAEDYHQDYYKKCPLKYNRYRAHSGRDKYLKEIWKD
jgi:peptide methionine sulfoxide reductase msrA/msrB